MEAENRRRTKTMNQSRIHVPPLQEIPLQEASSSQTEQVHVEQEIQGLQL
jgi:hypothetical protein